MSLVKIISGGQTGADQAALDAAIEYGFPHGGWLPKGRLTEAGPLTDRSYMLKKMTTKDYKKRTLQNILKSDSTVIISRGKLTGGSKLTQEYAIQNQKPVLHLDLSKVTSSGAIIDHYSWILDQEVEILNVAGPRASKDPGIYGEVKFIIKGVLILTAVQAPAGSELGDYINEQVIRTPFTKPKSIDEAIEQMVQGLDLKSRVNLARMSPEQLVERFSELFPFFCWAFGEWLDSPELLAEYNSESKKPIKDANEAAAIVMAKLWKYLHDSHRMKVVK